MRRYTKVIIFVALALIFLGIATQITFFQPPRCQTFECFEEHMKQCKPANYLNDDKEATWGYKIKGVENGACVIEVTLLQAKAGELGFEKLSGYKMDCGYPKGVVAYPEKNLDSCHGRLKEEMQDIIIKRLHTYIVDNIGEIDESLNLVVKQSNQSN